MVKSSFHQESICRLKSYLSKTFPHLRNGLELEIDMADSDYLFDAVDIASDFELLGDSFEM